MELNPEEVTTISELKLSTLAKMLLMHGSFIVSIVGNFSTVLSLSRSQVLNSRVILALCNCPAVDNLFDPCIEKEGSLLQMY